MDSERIRNETSVAVKHHFKVWLHHQATNLELYNKSN